MKSRNVIRIKLYNIESCSEKKDLLKARREWITRLASQEPVR